MCYCSPLITHVLASLVHIAPLSHQILTIPTWQNILIVLQNRSNFAILNLKVRCLDVKFDGLGSWCKPTRKARGFTLGFKIEKQLFEAILLTESKDLDPKSLH